MKNKIKILLTLVLTLVFADFGDATPSAILATPPGPDPVPQARPGSVRTRCVPASPRQFSVQAPGVSLQNPENILSAVSLMNDGTAAKLDVTVTSIMLTDGKLVQPQSLPVHLGTIQAHRTGVLNADFTGGPFKPGGSYALTIKGTYLSGRITNCFTLGTNLVLPPAAPGEGRLTTIKVGPHKVSGGKYPPQKPKFDNTVNRPHWTIPTGPSVPGKPTETHTATEKAPIGDPPAIDFVANNSWGIGQSSVAEPSGAAGGGIIFGSANWFATYSTDGTTFHQLNPTTIFPNDAVGYCCDQIVQYAPTVDRFIWLLQGNGVRIAVATPATINASHGTTWTYWNLTPDVFGLTGDSFDYPDLSIGNNYLYMSWNVGGKGGGHLVARTSLAGLQAGGTIEIDFTHPPDSAMAWFSHLVQNTGDEIFWAGHNNTSNMRIFSLKEGSNTYFWQDLGISSWANTGISSTTPDGKDWLGEIGAVGTWIAGGTRTGNQVWFAWSAGTDSRFRQPHIEMVAINIDNNNPPNIGGHQQVQIWNNDYAFGYPALSTNHCTREVGMSFEYGGNGNWENHVVGFWGDFIAYITTSSDTGSNRFGDYVTIRQEPPTKTDPGNLFNAYGFGMNKPGKTDIHYVLFGRPAGACNK